MTNKFLCTNREPIENESVFYKIDGFRSLIDFELSLSVGLNCLVGPNGSGKSNFIDALGFLAHLLRSSASIAVSRTGGIARVFSQEYLAKPSAPLKFLVEGVSDYYHPRYRKNQDASFFRFSYFVEIRFNRQTSSLVIIHEELKLSRTYKSYSDAKHAAWLGHVEVKRPVYKDCIEPKITISKKLATGSSRNPLSVTPSTILSSKRSKDRQRPVFTDFIDNEDSASDGSIFSMVSLSRFPALRGIERTISRGRALNIVPERARTADDMSSPPFIKDDGSGISSTLFAIQEYAHNNTNRVNRYYLEGVDENTLDNIVDVSKIVVKELESIEIKTDIHSGKYHGFITVTKNRRLKIPFSSVSDGTIKWLALVTSVITSRSANSIEEPENFIHPKMQSFIVSFIKDNIDDDARQFGIISTHSETLINACAPNEVIVFDYISGQTVANRVSDNASLIDEINKTGFGLGFYYARNAIS